jgi:lambda repressor-like predicted transcriptional regulator
MTRKEIQDALRERGISQASIAREAKIYPATFSQFLRRKFKSERLSRLLDKKLGVEGAIR